ncbi:MAG TPA: glycosyltransferase family 2 protein [Microbacteriaceae bacterium]|nr:glycosyltransferase family 2 protein [Microbacteriaceae bacterium]
MESQWSRTLVVLPAYNEAETVGATVAEVRATLPGIQCLVVDDGSRDETAAVAAAAGAQVASFPFNIGVGGAMRFGYRYAVRHGFETVIQIDADGQHDPRYVPQLVDALSGCDIVIGARFAGEGEYSVTGPRKWAMSMLAFIIGRAARVRLTDTTSGFRATGPRATAFFAREYPAEYLGDTVESLVDAIRAGLRVSQVPVAMRPRLGGIPSQNAWKSTVFLVRAGVALVFAFARPRRHSHGESSLT